MMCVLLAECEKHLQLLLDKLVQWCNKWKIKIFFFFFFFLLIFLIFYIIYINMYIQNMKITRTITRKTRTETYSLKGKHKPVYNRFTILKLYHLLVFS